MKDFAQLVVVEKRTKTLKLMFIIPSTIRVGIAKNFKRQIIIKG